MELNASWTRESKLKAELEEEKQIHQQDVTTYLYVHKWKHQKFTADIKLYSIIVFKKNLFIIRFELKESRDREMEWYGYKMLAEKKMTKQETRSVKWRIKNLYYVIIFLGFRT